VHIAIVTKIDFAGCILLKFPMLQDLGNLLFGMDSELEEDVPQVDLQLTDMTSQALQAFR
jgi:hypothetical protein